MASKKAAAKIYDTVPPFRAAAMSWCEPMDMMDSVVRDAEHSFALLQHRGTDFCIKRPSSRETLPFIRAAKFKKFPCGFRPGFSPILLSHQVICDYKTRVPDPSYTVELHHRYQYLIPRCDLSRSSEMCP